MVCVIKPDVKFSSMGSKYNYKEKYIFSSIVEFVATYGAKSWTVNTNIHRKLLVTDVSRNV
jgi:hypothetical protein